MTVFVETDFLLAIAKDDDWLQESAEDILDEHEVVTSPSTYLDLLIVLERHQSDFVRLFANLLDIVPVGDEEEEQIVLKAVAYFEDGMTPFDSFHAATAETRGLPILSSDKAHEDVDSDRLPLEPDRAE
ncbi:PIN domain nuclease [Halobacteriales archaeon SW_7_68_16]|nr:MAG: PIN domain nuclease [Halobacteriales archaeon SW_7_68_16]